jgi:hypothetical protein
LPLRGTSLNHDRGAILGSDRRKQPFATFFGYSFFSQLLIIDSHAFSVATNVQSWPLECSEKNRSSQSPSARKKTQP